MNLEMDMDKRCYFCFTYPGFDEWMDGWMDDGGVEIKMRMRMKKRRRMGKRKRQGKRKGVEGRIIWI